MYKCKILNSWDHSKEKGVNVQNVRYHRAGFTDSHFGKAVKYLINHNVRSKIKEYWMLAQFEAPLSSETQKGKD